MIPFFLTFLLAFIFGWFANEFRRTLAASDALDDVRTPEDEADDFESEGRPDYRALFPSTPPEDRETIRLQPRTIRDRFAELGITVSPPATPAVPAPAPAPVMVARGFPANSEIKATEEKLAKDKPTVVFWHDPDCGYMERSFPARFDAVMFKRTKPGALIKQQ